MPMQVKFKNKSYEVQLEKSQLVCPLVLLPGCDTEIIHPIDCIRLGVFCGGYFNSRLSNKVHGRALSVGRLANKYFKPHEIKLFMPSYYQSTSDLSLGTDPLTNYFGVAAGSSYEAWKANGWIQSSAPEGWFECYTQAVVSNNFVEPQGYQLDSVTDWLIEQKRMLSFVARHSAQLKVATGDLDKRRRQRQALLQWASPLAFLTFTLAVNLQSLTMIGI